MHTNMINITREKNVLTINFNTGLGWITLFTRESSSELDAVLLKEKLENRLGDRIETIKREAYERGYTDKTKRRPRQGWHSTNIDRTDI